MYIEYNIEYMKYIAYSTYFAFAIGKIMVIAVNLVVF